MPRKKGSMSLRRYTRRLYARSFEHWVNWHREKRERWERLRASRPFADVSIR
jgi:hypothetical protein